MTGDLTELFEPDDAPEESQGLGPVTYKELQDRGMSRSLLNTIKKASALITLKETLSELENK